MKNTLKTFAGTVLALSLLMGAISVVSNFASAANYPITGQNFYLSGAGVTSSQTTVPLTSLKTPDGRVITMAMIGTTGYGTLEPQSTAKTELITFTGITQNANGTATLTGVTRGIDFAYPYAASSAYRQAHAGGSTFIISNTPNWYYDNFPIQGDNNLNTWPVASTSVASRGYVDYVAFNGASVINATSIAKGIVQLATGLQAASSTVTGSTGASLALSTTIATSTYNSATADLKVVVTQNNGKIDPNFIGGLSTTTTIGYLPAFQIALQRQVFSTPGTTTFSVPSGITKVSTQVLAGGGGGGGAGTCGSQAAGAAGGAAGGYANKIVDITGTSTIQVFVGSGGTGASGSGSTGGSGTWSTFGTNGFYASSTPGIGPVPGIGLGGDFNVTGGAGGGSTDTTLSTVNLVGGAGGSSVFGGGGRNDGNAGNYGAGGGGATCRNNAGSVTGGNGSQGLVIVGW